ncbi:hypothetical protein BH09BAC6_BH09BAC6_05320 [soil metagenome]|jgi:hypothetical protein
MKISLLLLGFLFVSSCLRVSKAMDKETKAKFLVMNFLSDSLRSSNYEGIKFSKLDTNKSNSIMRFYMPHDTSLYWISCMYKIRNRTHYALFGMDTTLKKIDTVLKRN